MLDKQYVLDIIHASSIQKPKNYSEFIDHEKEFKNKTIKDNLGGWVVIHQEFPRNSPIKNYIVSVHKNVEDVPFHTFTRHHTAYPVGDELLSKTFNWSRFPRE